MQSTSQLVTLKQRERATLRRVMEDSQLAPDVKLPVEGVNLSDSTVLPAIETGLGVRPVITPATENCMAMALAQDQDPLVLRFWGTHYSTYVHTQAAPGDVAFSPLEETKPDATLSQTSGAIDVVMRLEDYQLSPEIRFELVMG